MHNYIIAGETATGKSSLAIMLAKHCQLNRVKVRIINGDSQQIFSELPVLSDQPKDFQGIKHELYSYKNINDNTSSFTWMQDVLHILDECAINKECAIIVGGSGFYLRNLINGHYCLPQNDRFNNASVDFMYDYILQKDPNTKIIRNDTYRVSRHFNLLLKTDLTMNENMLGCSIIKTFHKFRTILLKSDMVEQNITLRIEENFDSFVQEVSQCQQNPLLDRIIGFREINAFLQGRIAEVEAKKLMRTRVRQYAKRQRTWFKRMNFDFVGTKDDFWEFYLLNWS